MVLERLRPKFLRLGVISQKFQGETEFIEPWYGSSYNARKIDPKLIESWSVVQSIPEFHLPEPNVFIPTDFMIVPKPEDSEEMPRVPVLIVVRKIVIFW